MQKLLFIGVLCVYLAWLTPVAAASYTENAFYNEPHPKPSYFTSDTQGGFYGMTENDILFQQTVVANNEHVRLQKFTIGDVLFYISDRGIINADTDLRAISIYATLG
jgi:hypothetical protein